MTDIAGIEFQLLEEAARSPVVALMRLTIEIDKELQRLLAVFGLLAKSQSANLPESFVLLEGQAQIPNELKDAVVQFWHLRNTVVHNETIGDKLPLRALDYGFRILRLLRSIPRHAYIVTNSDVQLFSDKDCRSIRQDVRGVIVETISADGKSLGKHIYPSKQPYVVGTSLTWEWNMGFARRGWNETWYHDPETNECKLAWSGSMEFVGRDLSSI